MKKLIFAAVAAVTALVGSGIQAEEATTKAADLEMWRLDCGDIHLDDGAIFSDTHLYDGEAKNLTGSCYLIRHGEDYMLWDAGLPKSMIDEPVSAHGVSTSLKRSLVDQLVELGIETHQISKVAISHYHYDHAGQLPDFPDATLLISAKDWEVVARRDTSVPFFQLPNFAPWLSGDGNVQPIAKDLDVFGDGSVQIKATPGHTPGHNVLLVRLPETGDVLLTGDLYHFEAQAVNHGVPQYNYSRVETLASMARFDQTARNLDALVVIQHDPRHLGRLPAFPESAR